MAKRIAIIGSGISGLTCGYLLNKNHHVDVYEAADYIGGHTATVDVSVDGQDYAIDTGFIVYNDWTYPNFIKLLQQLGVDSQPTEMSFSVKNIGQNLEYNGNTINSLFAQRRNLLRPKFWRIVLDILRFNRLCKTIFSTHVPEQNSDQTLGQFLDEHGFSQAFCDNYILPMCAAIWSATLSDVRGFSLRFFLQFFNNHGLLNITNRPQWYTIIGGSKQYIEPLIKSFKQNIKLNCPVNRVNKTAQGYVIDFADNKSSEPYDDVIFACHSDQALGMLAQPTAAQGEILSAMPYANNEVVLHTDTSVLPDRKLAWASWNYLLKGDNDEQRAPTSLTYNMNILQRLDSPHTFCVTLNNSEHLDSNQVLRRFNYSHPQFSVESSAAQNRRNEICGIDNLHFCGAYWYNGFHEDGVRSALDVCNRFGEAL